MTDKEALLKEFLERFPISKLKTMTLEEYTDTKRENSFCYWIESKLKDLGSIQGNTAYKFGIFEYLDKSTQKGAIFEGKYTWLENLYGKSAEEAYHKVRSIVVEIAEAAAVGDFQHIDKINLLGSMFRWKIAFLYANKQFIPIFSKDLLIKIARDIDSSISIDTPQSELYRIITLPEDEDIWSYMSKLVNKYSDNHNNKKMETQEKSNQEKLDEYIKLLEENHNLIFHGAPGTGKTYTAKLMAAKMILKEAIKEENMTPVQKTEFESRCGFVQFHPSYDYTDFVEGIRPNANANGFERKDGVFKEFCKRALENKQTNDICDEIKNDATVWKVSLAKYGENEIRTDCLENGYIRIGWAKYGDVDFDEQKFDDLNYTNLRMLRWFQKEMKVGDIVVSCFSSESTDAIGIIEGDYEYSGDSGEFPRFRKVKWLVKGINENIVELNRDRIMIGQTLYQMWIRPYQIKEILKKYSKQAIQTEPSNQSLPYIFIIDEINRGETSKIFGELFYSLDLGYRGKNKVKTQYQNLVSDDDIFKDDFYVPDNVYIIGTMNDIDRSVESMDFAFRRRFAWKEIKAEDTQGMLNENLSSGIAEKAIKKMNALNGKIKEIEDLGENYQIGAAYFKKLADYKGDFQQLWDYHLKSLLVEYLRGTGNETKKLTELKMVYFSE